MLFFAGGNPPDLLPEILQTHLYLTYIAPIAKLAFGLHKK